jgi:hypothetical protein
MTRVQEIRYLNPYGINKRNEAGPESLEEHLLTQAYPI